MFQNKMAKNNTEDSVYQNLVCWLMGSIHIEWKTALNSPYPVSINENENNSLINTRNRLIGIFNKKNLIILSNS